MMTNLFSTFDRSSSLIIPLNWMSTFLGLIFIPSMFWLIPSRLSILWIKTTSSLHKKFKTLLGSESYGSTLIFISLVSMIMFNNFLGLFPYIFTSTSHLVITLTLALPLWLSFMVFGWLNNTTHMLTSSLSSSSILFITSEVFFFISFFWGFFHSSLSPSIELGMNWPPSGITTSPQLSQISF